MFTGIIEAVGRIQSVQDIGGDKRFTIAVGKLDMSDVALGDSIACNGVCLTVVDMNSDTFVADVSGETIGLTGFRNYGSGQALNLEKALTPTSRLGGHLVSGHVDGIGVVKKRWQDARSWRFIIEAPQDLARYIAHKGSITVDGISLTVNRVDGIQFELNIVPHTLAETIMEGYQAGTEVNLEVDQIARYLERLLMFQPSEPTSRLTAEKLAEFGFHK
ncbi:riboflavin synthase [Pleionea litopenaei]|uniref:Riboflavin synthase n=1 Tax=Pleionea litopenaei TaxID=3070815 RepID=A0AA51RSA5_9GAMM|nr:riboflavin synthase [Pleionea sp. HL-JVS1]WMS86670.1 riboflavin synthase [Pleionea sp. HL-JVS1]